MFIVEQYRGIGLSKFLMQNIVAHTDLQGLRRFMLATSDAHDLYTQFGFQPVINSESLMQVWHPAVYT